MGQYKVWKMPGIGERPRWVIEDENGNIVNKNPSKEELKCLKEGLYKHGSSRPRPGRRYTREELLVYFNRFYDENGRVPTCNDFDSDTRYPSSGVCHKVFGSWNNAIRDSGLWDKRYNEDNRCEFIDTDDKRCTENLDMGNARQCSINGKLVWFCRKHGVTHYQRYNPNSLANIIKSLRNCRTGNQNPNHESTKGDNCIELACMMYGYLDLNKKYDNYTTEIDCQDPITGLLYQIIGRRYNRIGRWDSGPLEREWCKDYEDMIFFCFSNDRKIVEKIYRIPFKDEIKKKRKCISIYKNSMKNSKNLYWYEKYRVDDEEELKKANDIWQKILEKKKKNV